MKFWSGLLMMLLAGLLIATFGFSCDDDDDDDDATGAANKDEICSNLGDLPVEGGTMSGYFDFGGSEAFPLSLQLEADNSQFSGTLNFSDNSQSYSGNCSGYWEENGFLFGNCGATGDSDGTQITIELFGNIGNNAACGTWDNQFDQSGDFWVWR